MPRSAFVAGSPAVPRRWARKAPIRPIAWRHWAAPKARDAAGSVRQAELGGQPADALGARLEGAAAVAPHLGRHQRLQRLVQLGLGLAQFGIGQAAERDVALAAWIGADPGFAGGAHPQWAVVVTVGRRIRRAA